MEMRVLKEPSLTETTSGRAEDALFAVGDYVAGALAGAATAAAVRATVWPELDMVLAMVIGMGVGMGVHLVMGLLLAPVIGAFHAMIPGSLIGMYGGMSFAMRDTMQQHGGSPAHVIAIGAAFGLVVTGAVRAYDRVLRGGTTLEE
jgi:hypothetical protein